MLVAYVAVKSKYFFTDRVRAEGGANVMKEPFLQPKNKKTQ